MKFPSLSFRRMWNCKSHGYKDVKNVIILLCIYKMQKCCCSCVNKRRVCRFYDFNKLHMLHDDVMYLNAQNMQPPNTLQYNRGTIFYSFKWIYLLLSKSHFKPFILIEHMKQFCNIIMSSTTPVEFIVCHF